MSAVSRRWFVAQSLGLLFVGACASAPAAGAPNRAGDVITQADLSAPTLTGSSVLDAIRRLRPRFLNERTSDIHGEVETPQVSLNGGALGPLSDLSRLDIGDVQEIRYLSTADANLRFGLASAMRPVLLVTLRPR
jgi:hypothetical protein